MVRNAALVLLGALACILGLELLFQVLPVSTSTDTGYHIDSRIVTYRPHHEFRLSTGWNLERPMHLRANNFGFLSQRDFVPNPKAIALVGDSFVNASMLEPGDRIGDQLQRALGARPVYAMGGPGSSLLDYAERIRLASEKLEVRDFVVVLEMGDIRQVYCGSGNVHGPCLDRQSGAPRVETQPAPSTLKLLLRHSAFLQYILGHLRFDPMSRLRKALAFGEPPVARGPQGYFAGMTREDVDRILAIFFERTAPFRKGRLLMVVDSDRLAINRGETATDPMRAHLISRARTLGAEVIDTDPIFRQHVERTGLHLEVSPHDSHWNGLATQLVASAVAGTLTSRRRNPEDVPQVSSGLP
ncbi:MAG: hypothetical protein WCJ69_00990 [Betaproteobacteria bacterium]|jgi:hypothetical protein